MKTFRIAKISDDTVLDFARTIGGPDMMDISLYDLAHLILRSNLGKIELLNFIIEWEKQDDHTYIQVIDKNSQECKDENKMADYMERNC
jgi:hypothetical protein